ncbi:MAG: gamma-glutamyltransferase [Acidiferrobacterales bacterium]
MSRCAYLLLLCITLLPLTVLGAHPPEAAIASAAPLATAAGAEILKEGGNAFDAAVAIAAALAVVEPYSSGLGGGGFWLLHRASDGFETMVDGRERAPLAASANMYLDRHGDVVARLSLDGPLAAAIPGTPAALVHIARKYGRLPLARSLAPAIRLATEGFAVTPRYQTMARLRAPVLLESPAAARVFLDRDAPPVPGTIIRQPDLAATLELLAHDGRAGFYAGAVADRLVRAVREAGGIWSQRDLSEYRVTERQPLQGRYRGVRVTSAPLPSSGGIVLIEMLNILSHYNLDHMDRIQRDHTIIEAMRLAYRDRARYLGDPDFVHVDTRRLLSSDYAADLSRKIGARAGVSTPGPMAPAGLHTTHFSVIDKEGNRVAATLTLNTLFGSGFMPPGTGVVLNNEMDDFVAKPGVPNTYGLVGTSANAIAPGKRPLSSMTPTFLETPDAVVVLGTPGGSRIISMVLLATLEVAEHRGSVKDWVALKRFHHQYLPDQVEYEPGAFSASEIHGLEDMGYKLKPVESGYGNMQALVWYKKRNRVEAASDPRGEGQSWVH